MDNTFKCVAQEIISESIKSAVFIDDEIPLLFSGVDDETKICQPLYEALQTKDCSLDFSKFVGISNINEKLLFERKDLVILDWELDSVEPKYKSTLEIIDKAVETDNLHFVCIYSNKGDDFGDIYYKILAYYSENIIDNSSKNRQSVVEFIESDGSESDIIIKDIISHTKEFTLNSIDEKECQKRIASVFKARIGEFKTHINDLYTNSTPSERLLRLGFDLNRIDTYRLKPKKVYKVCRKNYLQINNTFFAVFKKGEQNTDELYNNFLEAISSANEAFLTFMSMEMRNKLLGKSSLIGKQLGRINEAAFFYHKDNIAPDEAFDEFMVELWESYNTAGLYKEKSCLLSVIDNYKKGKDLIDPSEEDLAKLNFYYNIDHTALSSMRNIGFGDIFLIKREGDYSHYMLCITPHCDCLNPDKTNGFYYFVKGKVTSIQRGLDLADSGFITFIKQDSDAIICVEWILKPFTLYICEKQRNISTSTAIVFGDKLVDLKYCCTLKENYCQRITNKAFSNPIRVGISFVKKQTEESCGKFRDNTCKHIIKE